MPSSDWRRFLQRLEHAGYTLIHTRGHLRINTPDGRIVHLAATPSDHRAQANATARLRRHGVNI